MIFSLKTFLSIAGNWLVRLILTAWQALSEKARAQTRVRPVSG